MKKFIVVFVVIALFASQFAVNISANEVFSENLIEVSEEPLKNPAFSHKGGFYEDEVSLSISTDEPDTKIYYTTDGSDPVPGKESTSEFDEFIKIKSRSGDPNVLSLINTANPEYDGNITTPNGEVFKCTIIKALAITNDGARSDIVTNSYFIDENMKTRYSIPVISLVTDYANLFDSETGIYTSFNCMKKGSEWERPMHIEFFEPDGKLAFSQNIGARINGGYTRVYPQKSFRLYANEKYDAQEKFKYDVFQGSAKNSDNEVIDSFKRLLLRNGGNDWQGVMMRDSLIQGLVSHLNVDTQASRPCVLFLNGEYWGVHNIRERYDNHYLKSHYDLDKDKVAMLDVFETPEILEGTQDDVTAYFEDIVNYLEGNSITDENTYEQIKTKMDVENFIDYNITQIFVGNNDWPGNNVTIWKYKTDDGKYHPEAPKGQDGRWRWVIRDTDFGLGIWDRSPDHNTLGFALGSFTESGIEYANAPWAIFILTTLLKNDEFRNEFISRFADQLNTTFTTNRVKEKIEIAKSLIEEAMPEHYDRWNVYWLNMSYFKRNTLHMKEYARVRPDYVRGYIVNEFSNYGVKGPVSIKLNSDTSKGHIKINTIDIDASTPGVENQSEWSGIYFKGVPVTLKAVPSEGFEFCHWSGIRNISKTSDTISFIPTEDMSITAVYKPIGSPYVEEYYYGDFNDDKTVDAIDFALLRMKLLGITHTYRDNEDATFQKRVDVNGDTNINSVDFAYLRKFLLGKISEFPVGSKFKVEEIS